MDDGIKLINEKDIIAVAGSTDVTLSSSGVGGGVISEIGIKRSGPGNRNGIKSIVP